MIIIIKRKRENTSYFPSKPLFDPFSLEFSTISKKKEKSKQSFFDNKKNINVINKNCGIIIKIMILTWKVVNVCQLFMATIASFTSYAPSSVLEFNVFSSAWGGEGKKKRRKRGRKYERGLKERNEGPLLFFFFSSSPLLLPKP